MDDIYKSIKINYSSIYFMSRMIIMLCFNRNRRTYKIRKRGKTIGRIIHLNRSMLRPTITHDLTSPKTTTNPMRNVNSWKQKKKTK